MKNLKENIKKNNMKKLMLSAVLGMFCYCTNNATKPTEAGGAKPTLKIISISDALTVMLRNQVKINEAKKIIEVCNKKIYSTIKGEEEKITKKNVLVFITNQFKEGPTKEGFDDNINKIKQYFHLEEIKDEKGECNDRNMTEIFWAVPSEKEVVDKGITEEEKPKIKEYFDTIIEAEKAISEKFKEYYDTIILGKEKKQEEGQVLGDIVKECYEGEEGNEITKNFSAKLEKLCETDSIEKNVAKEIIATIIKRITPDGQITEEKLKAFISKQRLLLLLLGKLFKKKGKPRR